MEKEEEAAAEEAAAAAKANQKELGESRKGERKKIQCDVCEFVTTVIDQRIRKELPDNKQIETGFRLLPDGTRRVDTMLEVQSELYFAQMLSGVCAGENLCGAIPNLSRRRNCDNEPKRYEQAVRLTEARLLLCVSASAQHTDRRDSARSHACLESPCLSVLLNASRSSLLVLMLSSCACACANVCAVCAVPVYVTCGPKRSAKRLCKSTTRSCTPAFGNGRARNRMMERLSPLGSMGSLCNSAARRSRRARSRKRQRRRRARMICKYL